MAITSSLAKFYDDVVYWEIAKNNNRFFVTFEEGLHGLPNNKQESIGTAEISYPHTLANTASLDSFKTGKTRNSARYDAFLEDEEKLLGTKHSYNGYITTTELKNTKYFKTVLTSSFFKPLTNTYEISGSDDAINIATRTVSASYYYPYSNHQLSIKRKSPTLIIDLDKSNELPNGIGTKGYVIIPENTHPEIKRNLDFYLEKAGYVSRTSRTINEARGTL